MKLVIDIPEEVYKFIKDRGHLPYAVSLANLIEDGIHYEERPKGKWIEKEDYVGDTYYDCSNCGNSWSTLEGTPWQNGMSFCPNCGANMVVDLCSICKHGDNCERSDKGISFANHSTCWKFER